MNEIWAALWVLQNLDQKRARQLKERETAPGAAHQEALAHAAETAVQNTAARRERLAKLQSDFRQLELDLRATEARLRQDEKKLYGGEVGNAKEITQLEHRVEEERLARGKLEERYFALLDESERLDLQVKTADQAVAATKAELEAFEAELIARAASEAEEDRLYHEAREAVCGRLPKESRGKYELVQANHPGSALVRVHKGSCAGCHNAISQAEIERVAHLAPAMATCENCGRILGPEPQS